MGCILVMGGWFWNGGWYPITDSEAKKRVFCAAGKPSVFANLEIGRKKTKFLCEFRKTEAKINSDCYFLVFILCICIVLILLKYVNIYLVLI